VRILTYALSLQEQVIAIIISIAAQSNILMEELPAGIWRFVRHRYGRAGKFILLKIIPKPTGQLKAFFILLML